VHHLFATTSAGAFSGSERDKGKWNKTPCNKQNYDCLSKYSEGLVSTQAPARLTFKNSTFYPRSVFMYSVCISEQTAIISRKCVIPPGHSATHSRRRSQNKPPHDYNAIPAANKPPPPPQIALLSGLHSCILYYYLYLFCFIVFYLTPVLIRFVKLWVCRDLYTTRARMHIASP